MCCLCLVNELVSRMNKNEKKNLSSVASLKGIDIYGNKGYMVHHLKAHFMEKDELV